MSKKPIITKDDWLYKTDQEIIDHVYKTFVVGMAPKSINKFLCLYLGDAQGCAIGCCLTEEKRRELDETIMTDAGGTVVSAIDHLVDLGYVELPQEVSEPVVTNLQQWHDLYMEKTQDARRSSFPYAVTNPLTEFIS